MYRVRCQSGGARSTGTGSCRSLGELEGAEHGCERVRTPAKYQSRGLFVVGWSQRRGDACMERLKPGAAGRARSSRLNPRKSEPRVVPRAGLVAGSRRMLRALSDLVLLHLYIPQGWALRPCWEPWGWGTAGLGVPRGDGISPAPRTGCWHGDGGGLQGWRALPCRCCCRLDCTRFFPAPSPLKGEVLRRMENFPLCLWHCGFKAQGGLRPRGLWGRG